MSITMLNCYAELADALGVPEDQQDRLLHGVGEVKAWDTLIGMVETYVYHADKAADAERGQPRRPGTPEAVIAYPAGLIDSMRDGTPGVGR